MMEVFSGQGMEQMGINLQDLFGGQPLAEAPSQAPGARFGACRILAQEEAQKLIDMDEVTSQALERAEQSGIVFIDEIDKIAICKGRK